MSRSPLIYNPRAIPVVGTDAHLPAVPIERLHPAAVLARFAAPPAWTPEFPGDNVRLDAAIDPRPASVLVPLVRHGDELRVLLTRRTDHLRNHAGQISFPGGRVDPGDVDAVGTALREAQEEVGLAPQAVRIIGSLPSYTTVTSFVVTPVVGLIEAGQVLQIDPFEVAEVFEVPLLFLMNPAHHQRHVFEEASLRRQFLSMPWRGPGLTGEVSEHFIWGATAAMLRNLYRFFSA
ncbi:MAG: CoA pyrophosphatase [Burkholderiales bacterium]